MQENKQDDENLINNSVNTNIKKFRVAFEFENQEKPLIIELSFDEENKKILPDNKYFDKMHHNLKDKYKYDIKQVALKQWNEYLENKIKDYHAQISKYPADNYGDYLILVLFLEMVQSHWAENKLDQKNIWYNAESLQGLSQHFPQSILDASSKSQEIVGGEIFNNCADHLKSDLVKIVFIDDFPMEVVPQLFELQNFCTKPLEVDVTPFNLGKRIDYNENDNKNRTEKVVKEVKKILGIKDDATDPKNSVESNLSKKKAVSNLKFVWVETMCQRGVATDWFLDNLCGRDNTDKQNRVAYASYGHLDFNPNFDPYINKKKYAPFLDPQTVPNSIETVEPSNNLNENNKPKSDTVDTIHAPHTGELMSVETFKGDSLGLYNSKDKEAPKNESSNEMDGKFKDFDPYINKKKYAPFLDPQTVPNSIETVPYTAEPSNNLRQNTKTKRWSEEFETFGDFKGNRLGLLTLEKCKELGIECVERINENVDNSTEDENKTKTQKSKGQLILTWIFLILCGIVFVGAPSGAFLFGALFTLKGGIPVAGVMIFSGIGFGYSINKIKKLGQQNSDISLSSDNKDAEYPKTFIKYNSQEIKSPLLENRIKNKDVSNELNDKIN